MTDPFFPSAPVDRVALVAEGGTATVASATAYPLRRIWP